MAPYTLPKNAVWFITGCSSGIGQALCTYLSTLPSTRIVATARNPSTLSTLPSTPNILKLALDVTSDSSIQAALSKTLSTFGRIDILINNAGYNVLMEAELVSPGTAHALMETNFWGAVRLSQLVLPIFRTTNATSGAPGGVILQISSMGGRVGFAGNSFYHASKFALEGWTEALAKEIQPEWNVHVSLIEPGGVKTKYAETSVSSKHLDSTASAGKGEADGPSEEAKKAYANPNSQTNMLRAHSNDPAALSLWADADKVVKAIVEVVQKGEIPLRVPLGADTWGLLQKGLQAQLQKLEDARDVALSVISKEKAEQQLKSIEFLQI